MRILNSHWSSALFPLALMLILAGLSFWLVQTTRLPDERHDGKNRHDPDYIIGQLTLKRLDAKGVLQYQMTAPELRHYPDDDSTEVREPSIHFFHPDRPPVHLSAAEGKVSSRGKEVLLYGGVRVERAAQRQRPALTATMPDLKVMTEAETASTASAVRLVQGRSWLTGVGLDIDNKTQTYILQSQAVGQFASKTSKPARENTP